MALRKPSDLFQKKETSGVFESPEVSFDIAESYDKFRNNFDKVNNLSEKVEVLSQELSEKMTRTDLENAMYSQLMILDENFKSIRNQIKGLNKEDLKEFKVNVSNLSEIVGNLVENELPKYKKQVTKNEVRIGDKFDELKEVVEENIVGIRNEIDVKVNDIAEVIDTNLEYFNNQLQETSSEVKKTSDTYNKLSKIVESKVSKENEKLEEYSQVIQSLHEAFIELEKSLQEETSTYNQIIEEKFANISSDVKSTIHSIDENVNNKINSIDEDVDTFKNQVSSDISSIKADVVIFEKHNKDTEKTIQEFSEQLYKISEIDTNIININEDIGKLQNQYDSISNQSIETKKDLEVVERYIQNHHQELVELKEEVFGEIEKLPVGNLQENLERLEKKIDYIKETYSKIEPEVIVKEVIKEGLLNEPPNTKNSDPLTPLDQKFVTLDQLQNHYRLFINRIQQQLSTLGGSGETRLKYLDDIVGIATNASSYDGKYLKYNHSLGKFEFTDVDISNDSWADGVSGPYTLGSVGIGTTNPQSALDVRGAITVGVGTVGINSIFSTTDIRSWYYTNKSKSVTGDDTSPQAIYVGAAGTAMFMVGDSGNDVNQYTLSTPYDVSTAGASIAAFSVATQETSPLGIDFNPTGTKMFISGVSGVAPLIANGNYIHEYSLSTAWTVSSAGYTTSFNVTVQDSTLQGVTFGNSGSKMYMVGSTNDAVYQYSLSTPYSLASGVTYDSKSLVLGTNPLVLETFPTDISFNSTGTVLWVVGNTQDRIYEFRLGTAWDISTAVFYDDVYVGFNEITATGLHVIPEQNVAYIVGSSSDTVFQYSTNTPAIAIASSGISSVSSIVLNNETRVKDKLYVKGIAHFDSNILTQGTLQVDGAATVSGNLTATSSATVGGTLTASSAVTASTATDTINFGTSQTTGVLTLGGTSQTGTITVGRGTTTQTTNIQAGTVVSGQQKTINFGTGGASGSFTQINIGPGPSAGIGTVVINSGTNLLVGTTTSTGTASQPLQVTGNAYVSGSVGIGTTNPTSKLDVLGNAIIKTTSISDVNLRLQRSSSSGRAQFTLESESGSQIWRVGLTGGGTETFNFFDGTQNAIQLNKSLQVVSIDAPYSLVVGTTTATGTASQLLQVTGGAYVSGNLGVGNTNPQNPLHISGSPGTLLRLDGGAAGTGTRDIVITEFDTPTYGGIIRYDSSVDTFTFGTLENSVVQYALNVSRTTGNVGVGYSQFNSTVKLAVAGTTLINTNTLTGTASQALQVNSGAYVSGNLGIGNTNPTAKLNLVDNSSSDALRITQTGSGNALVVEDSTNPDATPFVIASSGSVGIGTTNPTQTLDLVGRAVIGGSGTDSALYIRRVTDNNVGVTFGYALTNSNSELRLGHNGGSGNFTIHLNGTGGEQGNAFNEKFKFTSAAQLGIGRSNPSAELDVFGGANVSNRVLIGTATSTGTASQLLQVTGGAYVSGSVGIGTTNPQSQLHITGQFQSTQANSTTTGGGQIYLNGATGNRIDFNTNGIAAPSFTTRSAGTKIVLYPNVSGATVDYAFGIDAFTLWSSVESSISQFKWYAGTTNIATLFGTGQLVVGTTTSTGTASQRLQVTGGAYVSGSVGIGTTAPLGSLQVGAGTSTFIVTGIGSVGIGTTNPVATLQVKDALAFETTNTTTSSTSQVAVDTFATATFRSAKYQVQITCPGQLATLGGITTGGSGYTAGTFNVTFTNSSGTGAAAQGTLTISNGTVSQIGIGTTGGSGYVAGDVLTAAGGSGLQVSVASTASPSGAILTLGSITSAGIGYTSGVGVGTTTLTFLGGTGTGAVGLATIFDGVITSATLLQQPTTGTGGTTYYSGSNYTTSTVLTIAKTDVTNTIITIAGSVGVSTFTSLTAHGIGVSDVVRVSSTSNGLTAGTDYFVVTTPSTTTFTLGSSVGIGTTFTTGSSLSIGFYRNSANAGGSVAYLNAITGVSTNFQVSDLLVLQNGTTVDYVEYGTIANTDILGTFAADISGANTRLLVTPTYATNTVKVARQAITV